MKQFLICFNGYVQGVGFRFTAQTIAKRFQVSGYVKNLPDGRVELLAEGCEQEIRAFVAEVKNTLARHIGETSESWRDAGGEYKGFNVLF